MSTTHRLTQTSYGFRVSEVEEPVIRKTESTQKGIKVTERPAREEIPGFVPEGSPLFAAAYNKGWNVDTAAGFSRWHGPVSGYAVAKALRLCGFATQKIKTVMRRSRRLNGICPYFY